MKQKTIEECRQQKLTVLCTRFMTQFRILLTYWQYCPPKKGCGGANHWIGLVESGIKLWTWTPFIFFSSFRSPPYWVHLRTTFWPYSSGVNIKEFYTVCEARDTDMDGKVFKEVLRKSSDTQHFALSTWWGAFCLSYYTLTSNSRNLRQGFDTFF